MEDSIKGLSSLPPIVIDHNEIAEIPAHRRVNYVMKKYLSSGNIVDKTKLIHYLSNAVIGIVESIANPTVASYLTTIKSGISLFELNTIFTNMIKIDDDEPAFFSRRDTMIEIIKENFFKTEACYNWDNENDQTKLIIQNITKTPKEIADKYKLKIITKEENNDTFSDEAIIIAQLDEFMFAIHYETSNSNALGYGTKIRETCEFFIPWYTGEDNSEPYNRCMKIVSTLAKMSIEVFCHRINPSINYVTIDKFGYQIHPKKEAPQIIRNINYDDLVSSMQYCIDNNKKRGIALVGQAGIGKSLLLHKLINNFKEIPTFVVRNEALLEVNSIRQVFNLVRDMKAILVFDDFDGLDVQNKGPITNEFLHQLDVNGDFKGIVIATVNDPSKVHYTLIARPERFDEVYLMRHPNNPFEVDEVINSKLITIGNITIEELRLQPEYDLFINIAIENKFTHARISSALDYCMSHYKEISGKLLIDSAMVMIEFQKTAKMFSDNGELKEGKMEIVERKAIAKAIR